MKYDYSPRSIELLKMVFTCIAAINSLTERVLPINLADETIIQLGNTIEEKLFLLHLTLEEVVKNNKLVPGDTSSLNDNSIEVIETLKKILGSIEQNYTIKLLTIPGIEIPSATIQEAKSLATAIAMETNIVYKDQIIF